MQLKPVKSCCLRCTRGRPTSNDETSASLHVDLLANAVESGGRSFYYNLATGHYLGLSTAAANWSNAGTEASRLSIDGASGYLAAPSDAITERIGKALIADAGISQAWTGGQSVSSGFAWSTGPLQGQNLNATGNGLTADGLVTPTPVPTNAF